MVSRWILYARRVRWPLVLAALVACHPKNVDPQKEPAKEDGVDVHLAPKALAAAQLATIKPRAIVPRTSVSVAGKVDFVPSRVARVGPPIAGRVATIPVVPGQKVGRGAVLATVDSLEVGRARADFSAARTRSEKAKAELERETRMMSGGASTERAMLLAQTERQQAQTELRASEDRLATLGLGAGASGQAVGLVAPIAGTVLQLHARVGQPVGPTDTLVVVGETETVWLTVDVYERDLGKVHIGDEVKVISVAYPGRSFSGKVDEVAAVVDPERHVLEARIVLPNEDGALKPGMTATARILGATVTDGGTVLAVPRAALQTVDGQAFVFVERTPGAYAMRPVERGNEVDGEVEILRGVAPDDAVVTEGSFILKSEALKAQMGSND